MWTWRAAFVLTGVAALLLAWALRRLPQPEETRTHRSLAAPFVQVLSRTAVFVLFLVFLERGVHRPG
jgi:predicted MFS family arabinose efflux permease